MKRPAEITCLADLPRSLPAGKRPQSTITIARLGTYKDPRYGRFEIAQKDVDGWRRNLSEAFGGRVAIDYDHSSDRGGGTKAAAWITGLDQIGKDVVARVEFTPKGARSIRNGDYRFISPTFTDNYRDEYGKDRGKALLGAALTNRPVLRGLPALSLSREPVAGAAKLKTTKGKNMKKKAKAKKLARKRAKKLARQPVLSKRTLRTLAQWQSATPHRSPMSRLWETAGAGHRRQPPGLDNDGAVLHAAIATRAARDRTHYFEAMAAHTGNPAYARLSDIPPAATLTAGDGVDPERSALYSTARGVAISAGISWHDALAWLEGLHELEALRRDDGGAGQPPWLDTRPLASPPRPWSDADWSRDQRRAAAAGLDVDHAQWQAGAEVGRDVVGETAAAQRQDRLVRAQQNHAQLLPAAKEREDTRRAAAIHDELHARARKRLAESTPRGSLNALAAAHDADIYRPPAPKPFDVGELAPQSTPAAHNGHARMGPASAP